MGMRGAELLVERLIEQRVPYIFGLCGHGIIGFLDAVYDRQEELRPVSVHHESVAGFMADAYYRVARTPVATFTSCGPGSANLIVALASAFQDSSAMLAITGNVPTSQWNRGPFQESGRYFQGDFVNAVRPYVKRSFQPTRTDMLDRAMQQSFNLMQSGRPGPVHLDVPLNVFVEDVPGEAAPWNRTCYTRPGGDPAAIREAIQLLLDAQRPVIVAGHGVQLSGAEAALSEFARALSIPVVTTPLGKGVFDARDELSLGPTGRNGTYMAYAATRNADVILALGTRFDDRATSAWLDGYTYSIPPTRLIHVDIDVAEIGRNYPAEIGIQGDARVVLEQLLAAADDTGRRSEARTKWLATIAGWRTRWETTVSAERASDAVPIRPERLVADLRAVLPDAAIVLADVGSHHNWLVSEYLAYHPAGLLQSWGFASMGFGVGGVLGAKLAAPDRPAVAVCGDAGFLMLPSVVATAVEYNIPAVWVVWNNYGYNSIREQQMGYFGQGREVVTSFRNEETKALLSPDYAAMARSMGAWGALVERPQDFGEQLQQALSSGLPAVLDVRVDRDARLPATGSWDLPPLPHPAPTFGWGEDNVSKE
jgi:acetolactate synthase-1/2/3 large subunit